MKRITLLFTLILVILALLFAPLLVPDAGAAPVQRTYLPGLQTPPRLFEAVILNSTTITVDGQIHITGLVWNTYFLPMVACIEALGYSQGILVSGGYQELALPVGGLAYTFDIVVSPDYIPADVVDYQVKAIYREATW